MQFNSDNRGSVDDSKYSLENALNNMIDMSLEGVDRAFQENEIDNNKLNEIKKLAGNSKNSLKEFASVFDTIGEDEVFESEPFDDFDYDEIKKLDGIFYVYQQTQSLPNTQNLDFIKKEEYPYFDLWAMERIEKIRANPDFELTWSVETYDPAKDWYMTQASWIQYAEKVMDGESFWGSNIASFLVQHTGNKHKAKMIAWIKSWLADGGYDADCFFESLCLCREEVSELSDYFFPDFSDNELIYAYRSGIINLEKSIRNRVLGINIDEHSIFDGLDYLSKLTAKEIGNIFTEDELTPLKQAILKNASTIDEDDFKIFFGDYLSLAIKFDWQDIVDVLFANPLLSHICWAMLTDLSEYSTKRLEVLLEFRTHFIAKVNQPRLLTILDRHIQQLKGGHEPYFFFDEKDMLLMTLCSKYHETILPLYALRINQIINDADVASRMLNKDYLAIAWSRMRESEMKML